MTIDFAEGAGDAWKQVLTIEPVGITIIAIAETVSMGAVAGDNPALIHHAAEAIQPRVLVASIAVWLGALFDIGQVYSGLRMRSRDYGT